ncbi:hypothetical protein Sjap_023813 [Stephania japonica]|uniref:Uncharacterized protein n=1 Tax=Stephania japonica TaxID=461633 RepID=A0AAP0ECA5_9MAGN
MKLLRTITFVADINIYKSSHLNLNIYHLNNHSIIMAEESTPATLSEKNVVENKQGEGHEEKVKHKKDKSSKEEKKSKKNKDGDDDGEVVDTEEEKSKDKKKKKKEKNPEDKNDTGKLKVKLEKIDAKMQDLVAKREEILKLIKEAEAQHQSAGENTTNIVGEGES